MNWMQGEDMEKMENHLIDVNKFIHSRQSPEYQSIHISQKNIMA